MGQRKPVVVLVGFSGGGKSAVGRFLADSRNLKFADVDSEVEKRAGVSVKNLIREEGEEAFRDLESEVLKDLLSKKVNLIATGGGILLRKQNRKALSSGVTKVHLTASVEELVRRISLDGKANRPIVDCDDLQSRIVELQKQRNELYDECDCKVWTDFAELEKVAESVQRHSASCSQDAKAPITAIPANLGKGYETEVVVGEDLISSIPKYVHDEFLKCTKVAIVTDSNVGPLHGTSLEKSFQAAGFKTNLLQVTAGETAKSIENVQLLCEKLVEAEYSRADVIIALGGGVIGDLVGLVASLVLRGINLVQVPTSVMAQVDASIGGKTGVNLYSAEASGKNLVGTFYPARFVVSDVKLLQTLPERSYYEGMAEVVKYGMIHSEDFLLWLEKNIDAVHKREQRILRDIVEFSSRAKLSFVVGDLEDKLGERAKLNFGHTIGHGVERLTNYREYFHGEAVAIGMVQAAKLGERLGISNSEVVGRLVGILTKLKLPTSVPKVLFEGLSTDGSEDKSSGFNQRWRAALVADKKRTADVIHFVFVERPGNAFVRELDIGDVVTEFAQLCRE